MSIKVAAVVGPTASGKTALAVELARCLNGEVISCDSMQIYKKMNIGTAKPTLEEMKGIPHHMIDIVDPTFEYSCADYAQTAKDKINEVVLRGKYPIFCGGTGLYVDHVLSNTTFSDAGRDDEYRKELEKEIDEFGVQSVYEKLKEVDPETAVQIHPNNTKRVIRALEIYHTTGKTKSYWDIESQKNPPLYDANIILLDFADREKLYERINKRVDIMLDMGLVDEVKSLFEEYGDNISSTALQGIGYKEMICYLKGKCSLDEAVENIKKGTRNYAKRQLTWFRRNSLATRIYVDECSDFEKIVNIAKNVLTD